MNVKIKLSETSIYLLKYLTNNRNMEKFKKDPFAQLPLVQLKLFIDPFAARRLLPQSVAGAVDESSDSNLSTKSFQNLLITWLKKSLINNALKKTLKWENLFVRRSRGQHKLDLILFPACSYHVYHVFFSRPCCCFSRFLQKRLA